MFQRYNIDKLLHCYNHINMYVKNKQCQQLLNITLSECSYIEQRVLKSVEMCGSFSFL